MVRPKYLKISANVSPEHDEWMRDYLYYLQINTGNPKLTLTDVVREAVEALREKKAHQPIYPRPDFIRANERKIRRVYMPREN